MTDWQTKRLGDVADVSAGNAAPQDEAMFADGIYPFFRTADAGRVRFGDLGESSDYLNDSGIKGLRKYPEGTILFPKSGASTFLNHRVMLSVEGYVSSHLATIVADRSEVEPRFLLYFLSTVRAQDLVQDHSYPSLNLPTISNIAVRLPPLPVQRKVVSILDDAFSNILGIRENATRSIKHAGALFESRLQSIFNTGGDDWNYIPLGDLSDFKNGLNFNKDSNGQTIRIVGVSDFQDNYVVPVDDLESVTIDGDLDAGYELRRNDILTVRSNGSKHLVGRCMLVGDLEEAISYSGFIIRIRFDTARIFPRYLLYFMKSQSTRRILTSGGGGANITNINQKKLSALRVPIPPHETQVRIASALDELQDELQDLKRIYERKIAAAEALRTSLLHHAFAGQLAITL